MESRFYEHNAKFAVVHPVLTTRYENALVKRVQFEERLRSDIADLL